MFILYLACPTPQQDLHSDTPRIAQYSTAMQLSTSDYAQQGLAKYWLGHLLLASSFTSGRAAEMEGAK